MKEYWEIQGPNKAPREHCIAFDKKDGSNIRAEYHRKRGWSKFGSRTVLIDRTSDLGGSIDVFMRDWADPLEKTFRDNKQFRGIDTFVAFLEYEGPNSFAGFHDPADKDQMKLFLFDVNLHKKGIMLPRDFVRFFGHLSITPVIYEGNLNTEFIQAVRNGLYPVKEGVVCKGTTGGQHGLWMAKIKTQWWFNELKRRAELNSQLKKVLADNVKEQGIVS